MCVRRFLMLIFILILIFVGGAFALYQFGDRVLVRMATPIGHYREPPSGSEMATTLIQQANLQLESLSAKSGADFDRAYVESQIVGHQDLLESIESHLLPQARAASVRQLLESMRQKVEEHLEQARELRQQLASITG